METTINLKPVLPGMLITAAVILLFGWATATKSKPVSFAKPGTKSEFMKTIYSGTPLNYRYYNDALNGVMKPIGGPANIDNLYNGDQNSNYVMVYFDVMSAYNAATLNNTCSGVLGIKVVDSNGSQFVNGNQLTNGDIFNESPFFIKGATNGWITFKVKPFMTRNEILTLIK